MGWQVCSRLMWLKWLQRGAVPVCEWILWLGWEMRQGDLGGFGELAELILLVVELWGSVEEGERGVLNCNGRVHVWIELLWDSFFSLQKLFPDGPFSEHSFCSFRLICSLKEVNVFGFLWLISFSSVLVAADLPEALNCTSQRCFGVLDRLFPWNWSWSGVGAERFGSTHPCQL